MTIIELEQALRNLIASQPMLNSGPNGEVINGMLMVVYSCREFMFKVQSYPSQDALKFNMMNEVSKLENNLVILVCQVMQERGINIMLYVPQNQYSSVLQQPYAGMQPQPNYGVPQMGAGYGQMNMQYAPSQGQMYAQPQGVPSGQADYGYAQPQVAPQPQAVARQQQYAPQPQPQRRATAAPYPKAIPSPKPTTTVAKPKPVASIPKRPKEEPVASAEPESQQEPAQKPSKKAVVDALMGDFQEPTEKAAGRDYLLELLKK